MSFDEKLLSWSGMGWGHFWAFGFLVLTKISIQGIMEGFDVSQNYLFQVLLEVDFDEFTTQILPALANYLWIPTLPGFLLLGWFAQQQGRFVAIVLMAVLTLILSPLIMVPTNAAMLEAGWILVPGFCVACIGFLIQLYLFEVTPQQWRGVVLIAFAFVDTLGGLMKALIMNSSQFQEGTDIETGMDNWWVVVTAVPLACLFVVTCFGLVAVRSDTPASLVNRGHAGLAFDRLHAVSDNKPDCPYTRVEFVDEAAYVKSDQSLFTVLRQVWAPLTLCVVIMGGVWLVEKIVLNAYYYPFQAYIGDSYQFNSLKTDVLMHLSALVGVIIAIAVWMKTSIKWMPAICISLLFVATCMCGSVYMYELTYDAGWELWEMTVRDSYSQGELGLIGAGLVLIYATKNLLVSAVFLLVLELFPSKSRALGVSLFVMLSVVCEGVASSVRLTYRLDRGLIYGVAGALFVIAVVTVWAFPRWFATSSLMKRAGLETTISDDTIVVVKNNEAA